MKKIILSIVIIIITLPVFAQPFAHMTVTTKGIGVGAGALAGKVEVTAAINFPISQLTIPVIKSLTIGRMFLLTNDEEDNYSITPSIGMAYTTVKGFTAYDYDDHNAVETISKTLPIYKCELGKDAYMGRVFIAATYCSSFYYSFGMKVFLNR